MIAAGLLHDTLEDTKVTLAYIEEEFGFDFARILRGCSEPPKCMPWMLRKEHSINFLKNASSVIRIVTLADKLNNIQSIKSDLINFGARIWKRFSFGKSLQAWYYLSLVESLSPLEFDLPGYLELYKEYESLAREVFNGVDISVSICNDDYKTVTLNLFMTGQEFYKDFLRQYLIYLAKEKKEALFWRIDDESVNSNRNKEVLNQYEPEYPVLSLEDLYKPQNEQVKKLKETLNELSIVFKDIPDYFNEKRCETLDTIAYYRPYHYNGPSYGIYIDILKFTQFTGWVMRQTEFDLKAAKAFALDLVLTHQRFHYLVELFATFSELASGCYDLYAQYKLIYSQRWSTEACIEETLANDFVILSHPLWSKDKLEFVYYYFERQLEGYKEATLLSKENRLTKYIDLEKSIFPGRASRIESQLLNINKLPIAQISLKNIPIYFVDDTRSQKVFRLVRKFLGIS